jgi:type I restriction enzyme S subunit
MTDLSKNGDTLGYSALIPKDNNYIFLHNQRIGLIEDISQEIDKHFLYWVMRTYDYQRYIVGHCSGSTVKHTSPSGIGSYIFRCPDINTQRKISSILCSLDDKIAVNKKICENLEAQAQALFKHWFVDFSPFKDGKFVESELGLIPEGWKISNIYEYIDVIYGAPYKSSLFNDKKNGLPLIRIRDLKTYSPQFYTPEILPTTEYIEAGNVVAGMDAEFIPYIWLGERGVLNQRCCKFKGKDNRISNYYILFLVKPELEYVQSYKTGTTVSHLGKSDIDRFRFVTPPLDVILSFSDMVNSMKEEVVTRAKESSRLSTLRDTLLPKLMSGQIKLNEYE